MLSSALMLVLVLGTRVLNWRPMVGSCAIRSEPIVGAIKPLRLRAKLYRKPR
jgi:hypothetical protein